MPKFLHVKNQVYQWSMQKNYGINIFDYEGHNPWHTRYSNEKSQPISLRISIQYCNSACLEVGKETQPTLWKVMPTDV